MRSAQLYALYGETYTALLKRISSSFHGGEPLARIERWIPWRVEQLYFNPAKKELIANLREWLKILCKCYPDEGEQIKLEAKP